MGKAVMYEYHDPKHQLNLKPKNRVMKKKSVKITYITSPLLVRDCEASEFRSVVQQLTGKESNTNNNSIHHHHHHHHQSDPQLKIDPATTNLMHCNSAPLVPSPNCSFMQSGEEDGGSFYDNRSMMMMNSLEFDDDYFWKDLALSFLQSSSVFATA